MDDADAMPSLLMSAVRAVESGDAGPSACHAVCALSHTCSSGAEARVSLSHDAGDRVAGESAEIMFEVSSMSKAERARIESLCATPRAAPAGHPHTESACREDCAAAAGSTLSFPDACTRVQSHMRLHALSSSARGASVCVCVLTLMDERRGCARAGIRMRTREGIAVDARLQQLACNAVTSADGPSLEPGAAPPSVVTYTLTHTHARPRDADAPPPDTHSGTQEHHDSVSSASVDDAARLLHVGLSLTPPAARVCACVCAPVHTRSQAHLAMAVSGACDEHACSLHAPCEEWVLRCTSTWLLPVRPDGHMLTLALPLAHPRRQMAAQSSARGEADARIALPPLADMAVTGVAVADVVSVTHDLRVTGLAAHATGCRSCHVCVALPFVGNVGQTHPRHVAPAVDAAGRAALLRSGRDTALLLVEPVDVATTWVDVRSWTQLVQVLSANEPGTLTAAPSPFATEAAAEARVEHDAPLLPDRLPTHVAIVMDGNGRWAKQRGLRRSDGHRAGVDAIHRVIRACRRLGIRFLTLYAFSAQNWSRPEEEVRILMSLLIEFVNTDCEELIANGVRLLINGDIARLPGMARTGLQRLMRMSEHNTGLTLCLALSYGGREEILSGVVAACRAAKADLINPASLTLDGFRALLPNPDVPDPDLLIRTSGEMRVSNFLLWQIAYTELYVTPLLWPDFDDAEMLRAMRCYAMRERRFGKTSEQIQVTAADGASSIRAKIPAAAVDHRSHGRGAAWRSWCMLSSWPRSKKPDDVHATAPTVSQRDPPREHRRRKHRSRETTLHAHGAFRCSAPLLLLSLGPMLLLIMCASVLWHTSTIQSASLGHFASLTSACEEAKVCEACPLPHADDVQWRAGELPPPRAVPVDACSATVAPSTYRSQHPSPSLWTRVTAAVGYAACRLGGHAHSGAWAGSAAHPGRLHPTMQPSVTPAFVSELDSAS